MRKSTHEIGCAYEKIAGDYLEKLGYNILEYNFRCRSGEIDIIAKDGEYLVFCEVKYRTDSKKGDPLEAVTYMKQKKISKCAAYYMMKNGFLDIPCRFDVIGISEKGINLLKNAFEYAGR